MSANLRSFRPSDVAAVVALVNTCNQTDNIRFRARVDSFVERGGDRTVEPERHYFVAEANGSVVGYADLVREAGTRLVARVWVHPAWRAEDVLHRLVERHLAQAGAFPERVLDIPVWPSETAKAALLETVLGFHHVRSWWRMRMDLTADVPQSDLPQGFILRTCVGGRDDRMLTRLMNDVFSEHWGEGAHTLEQVQHDLAIPWFDPDLLVFAETAGQAVGYVWSWVDHAQIGLTGDSCAFIDDLGVLAAHRRRGLGRALLLRALVDLKARGLAAAELEVDGPNSTAKYLYQSVGFSDIEEVCWFRGEVK